MPGANENQIVISIADTGVGIAEDQIDKIFEMFYQVDNDINQRVSGTGIGLAMVKELVNLHDAEIKVKSQLGRGTEFHLQFPAIEIDYGKSKKIAVESLLIDQASTVGDIENMATDDRIRILVVEDNHEMRTYIKSLIDDKFKTKTCHDGAEGIECAIEFLPDLIISDVMMPNLDGYELCRAIKESPELNDVPVILLNDRDFLKHWIANKVGICHKVV